MSKPGGRFGAPLQADKPLMAMALGITLFVASLIALLDSFGVELSFVSFKGEMILAFVGIGLFLWGFRRYMGRDMQSGDREPAAAIKLELKKRGPRIVVIGGGTGLSVLLKGLKEYSHNLTAVVTVTDDGGSSGRIREMGLLPPGDIRRCLVALAQTETLMDQVFQHRFQEGDGIAGHNLGNLLIAALTNITGDFVGAIKEVSKVLAVQGQVLPATAELVTLGATMDDDTVVMGETSITGASKAVREVFLVPPDCQVVPEALQAIEEAEVIILGPGSLYTSIIPNLLVPEIGNAIRSTRAVTIFVANIMTQPGETTGYSVSDHLDAVSQHIGAGYIDYVVVNDAPIDEERLSRYRQEDSEPVRFNSAELAARGIKLVCESLLGKEEVAWHDPEALARTIMRIVYRERGLAV